MSIRQYSTKERVMNHKLFNFEGEGVYAPYPEEEEDDKLTLNTGLGPLIAPHE